MLFILTIVTSHFLQTLMWYPYPKPKKPVEKCLKMAWVIHLIIFLQLFFVLSMLHSNVCQECRARERPVINVIWRKKLQTKGHRPRALKWPFIELVVFVHRKHCKKGNYNSLNLNTLLHFIETPMHKVTNTSKLSMNLLPMQTFRQNQTWPVDAIWDT